MKSMACYLPKTNKERTMIETIFLWRRLHAPYLARDESIRSWGNPTSGNISKIGVPAREDLPLTIPVGYQVLLVVSVQRQVLVWLHLFHDQIDVGYNQIDLDIVRSGHFLNQQDPKFFLFQ
jgi:hypothetical protein